MTDTLVAEQTKTCTRCPERGPQSLTSFSTRRASRDGLRSSCRRCVAAYDRTNAEHIAERYRAWYRANVEHIAAVKRVYREANAEHLAEKQRDAASRQRAILTEIKTASGCVDCGKREPSRSLAFHHPHDDKLFNVGNVRRSLEAILTEAAKCVVLCVVCHARRHAAERNEMKEAI